MLKQLTLAAISFVMATDAFAAIKAVPTIATQVDVQPVNGGINPDAFAYKITAKVLRGANKCEAKGVRVGLKQKLTDGVVDVTPMKRGATDAPRICTREWEPVYQTLSITVRGMRSNVDDVVVHNIDGLGTTTSVEALLVSTSEVTLTGYLDRVAAIGGESSGYALVLDNGDVIELDLATNNLDHDTFQLEGQAIQVQGVYKTVVGVEIASRRVLEVSSLSAN